MASKYTPFHVFPLSIVLSLGMVSATVPSVALRPSQTVLMAQNSLSGNWNALTPPNRGLPGGRQEGGGVRGPCPNGSEQITAISPPSDAGLTASESPSFYLYVPATIQLPMEFKLSKYLLSDENAGMGEETEGQEQELYKTRFTLTGEPGVIRVSLPANVSPLEVGENYYWSFSLVCKENAPEANIIRGGWIKRSQLSDPLQQELAQTPLEKRPQFFAREAMWYDTVSSLAQLRHDNPTSEQLSEQWQDLLSSVGLESIAQARFLECCTPQQTQAESPASDRAN